MLAHPEASPLSQIGTWRRFGDIGPVYEVIGVGRDGPDGERIMRIRVLESDEEADYKLADLVEDPREH